MRTPTNRIRRCRPGLACGDDQLAAGSAGVPSAAASAAVLPVGHCAEPADAPGGVFDSDLGAIIAGYHAVTDRLKRSHEQLIRHVGRLREELREKNRQLRRRERLAALGRMAAGVAHEIRNPLAGIGLFASLLRKDLGDRPGQLEMVEKLLAGIRTLESVVGEILAFAGEAKVHRSRVAMRDIIREVLMHVRPRAESLKASISIDPLLGDEQAYCDRHKIVRALVNLLLNALDATGQRGHVWVSLRVSSSSRSGRRSQAGIAGENGIDGFLAIAVEDDGPGVSSDHIHRIFDPFFTTKDEGTGLGLAIVHRIAESHGGFVTVEKRPGGGASFVLSLPRAESDEHEWPPDFPTTAGAGAGDPIRKQKRVRTPRIYS